MRKEVIRVATRPIESISPERRDHSFLEINRSRKNAPVETATHHQSTAPKNDLRSTTHSSFPFQVFRKYSHSLGPDELEYLEEILNRHDILDEDVGMSIELIAKEYNKQDGSSLRVSLRALRLTSLR